MRIKISALSDVGKERDNNEDAYAFCSDLNNQAWDSSLSSYIPLGKLGAVAIVADGMGGAEAGEIASGIAVKVIKDKFQPYVLKDLLTHPSSYVHDFLVSCNNEANKAILDYEQANPEVIGMGTTIVVAWIIGNHLHVIWCGDSRCYLFNPNKGLKKLTKDHSYVQELVDNEEIDEDEAFNHPDSNIITRCLGDVDSSSDPELLAVNILEGDLVLLCSDGLCGYCKDKDIENILYKDYKDMDKCSKDLVSMALNTGGFDNITVSLISTISDNQIKPSIPLFAKLKRVFKIH